MIDDRVLSEVGMTTNQTILAPGEIAVTTPGERPKTPGVQIWYDFARAGAAFGTTLEVSPPEIRHEMSIGGGKSAIRSRCTWTLLETVTGEAVRFKNKNNQRR